ncbi:MAG: PDZ domain-containing protein [Gemmatimonadales bacterium]
MRTAPVFVTVWLGIVSMATPLAAQIDARLLRYPDVSATQIAFTYAGDVWTVPKTGGTATRVSSAAGEESWTRFSPDGSRLAFSGNYDGNVDLYVVPTAGGEAVRLTYHPMPDRALDWYPDGRSLLFASAMKSGRTRFTQLYRVAATGGLAERLPVPYGELGAISPDGRWLAYSPTPPMTGSPRDWKGYRGGSAPEIWLFDLTTYESRNVSDSPANDVHPMWHGRTLYFVSDRDQLTRYNVWAYDLDRSTLRQVTRFTDEDITYAAIGPSEIVFQKGGSLHLLDLATERTTAVPITVVTDEASIRPRSEAVAALIQSGGLSPSGKRAVFEARGEIFTVPAEHGPVLNLTRTSGVAERWPSWSPDGRQVAYWSDRSGEYELVVRPADGSGTERKLTSYGAGFRYQPFWSPDGGKLAFVDQSMTIRIFDVSSGKTTTVDQGEYMMHGALRIFRPSWSHDGRWLAYTREAGPTGAPGVPSAIHLFDTRTGQRHQVTSGYFSDYLPTFDPEGRYLFFLSTRTLEPSYGDVDNTWIYANASNVVAVPLREGVPSPVAPRNDAERTAAPDSTPAPSSVEIDLDGFERRLVVLPVKPGRFSALRAVRGKVVYHRQPRAGAAQGEKSPIGYYDLKERTEQGVLDDADALELSSDGAKLLVAAAGRYAILDLKPGQKIEKPLRTPEMTMTVEPRAEWRQILADVGRQYRDYFYDGRYHGVDWAAMRTRYERLLEGAVTRWDVDFVIGELIAELRSGHTYRSGGDVERAPTVNVGLLGADWTFDRGAFRIAHLVDGGPWDSEVRSPLLAAGVGEGEYVLAVNGVPLEPAHDPLAAFQGLASKTVALTVSAEPGGAGARVVLVEPLADESRLRNLEWIERNRKRVDEATGGRVGYVYVPSTGLDGQTELYRQFRAQFTKDALIIDERWNSGGQIPDRFIELLSRPPLAFWAVRDGTDWRWPPNASFGPKVMLINGWSGSGGDAFPFFFREAKVGPLIGERTWGALIGISGVPTLIDGGSVTVPTFRMYGVDGRWFPEGHGVDPDIAVVADPTALARGTDLQLERGIAEILRLLETKPPVRPKRPERENRVP